MYNPPYYEQQGAAIMATVAKKRPSGPAKDVGRYQVTGNWAENIEQISDLGKGYLLVKFNTRTANAPLNRPAPHARAGIDVAAIPPRVKEFTPGQLRQLLERFSEELVVAPVDTVKPGAQDTFRTQSFPQLAVATP